jgi:hypothetical protein
MHYRLMYPSDYLNAADLKGKEVAVTIGKVFIDDVPDPQGTKQKKPVILFEGKVKKWPLPKTCARVISKRFGNDTEQWIGKQVTIYPTTCKAFGETVECVRIKE